MKNLLAPLVALLLLPACGGEREQAPEPSSPPTPTQGQPATETTTSMTESPAETSTATSMNNPAPGQPRAPMTDMQRDAVRALVSAFNAHDATKITALYAPDARTAGAGPTGWMETTGPAPIEDAYNRLFTAFPDVRFASPRAFLSGNIAIQEWVLTGTHKGEYDTVKPSNKPVGIHGASVYWFNDQGKITQDNTYYDAPAISTQIGSMKGKARPVATMPEGETQFVVATGTPDDNRWVANARMLYSSFGSNDEKSYSGAFARDATRTNYAQIEDKKGANVSRDELRAMMKAFPDMKVTARNVWGFGDVVIVDVVSTGTMSGNYGSTKATQKQVSLHALDLLRFNQDGKVVEMTSYGSSQELTAPAATGSTSTPNRTSPDQSGQTGPTGQPPYEMRPGNSLYPGQAPSPYPTSPGTPGSPGGTLNPGPVPTPTSTGIQRKP